MIIRKGEKGKKARGGGGKLGSLQKRGGGEEKMNVPVESRRKKKKKPRKGAQNLLTGMERVSTAHLQVNTSKPRGALFCACLC